MKELSLHSRVLNLAPSATLQIAAQAKALQKKNVPVISLTTGEPDFQTPEAIIQAAKRALDEGATRYTAARGTEEMLQAMCFKFKRDQGLSYTSEQVIATVGAKAAIAQAIEAVVGPGDEVILFAPYWGSYPEQVRLAGAKPVVVPTLAEEGYQPNLASFKSALTPQTKLVILNSPNNPTGAVWQEQNLRDVMKHLEGTSIWVISDEIYEHLLWDGERHVSAASFSQDAYERVLVVSGLSKSYAMTGWRVGVAAGSKNLIAAMAKLQEQRYSCVASMVQAASVFALTEVASMAPEIEKMRAAYEERVKGAVEHLAQIPYLKVVKPKGAFYMLLDVSFWMGRVHKGAVIQNDEMMAARLLSEAYLALIPGTFFGAPGSLRVSLASAKKDIEEGIRRLKDWLA